MRIPRIYLPEATPGHQLELPADAAHRVRQVLRLEPGHPLVVFDGHNGEFPAELAGTPKRPTAMLGNRREVDRESPLWTVLWAGLSKGEKLDWTVQKATELGVSEIRPVQSERSVRRLDPGRAAKNHQRWLRIAASACEQCGRNRLPRIEAVAELRPNLGQGVGPGLVLSETGGTPPEPPGNGPFHLLVGPEGGLSEEELAVAEGAGLAPTALGPRTLRTETAALTALAWAQTVAGDLPCPSG